MASEYIIPGKGVYNDGATGDERVIAGQLIVTEIASAGGGGAAVFRLAGAGGLAGDGGLAGRSGGLAG